MFSLGAQGFSVPREWATYGVKSGPTLVHHAISGRLSHTMRVYSVYVWFWSSWVEGARERRRERERNNRFTSPSSIMRFWQRARMIGMMPACLFFSGIGFGCEVLGLLWFRAEAHPGVFE